MSKALFLDVDGVLNTGFGKPFKEEALALVRDVLARTGTKLVLSSLWRVKPELLDEITLVFPGDWHADQCTRVHWVSGWATWKRGDQIAEWLIRHPEVGRYAIVDDDHQFLPEQVSRFVWTDGTVGLTRENAQRLVEILGEEA